MHALRSIILEQALNRILHHDKANIKLWSSYIISKHYPCLWFSFVFSNAVWRVVQIQDDQPPDTVHSLDPVVSHGVLRCISLLHVQMQKQNTVVCCSNF